jgi:hypothetical protein
MPKEIVEARRLLASTHDFDHKVVRRADSAGGVMTGPVADWERELLRRVPSARRLRWQETGEPADVPSAVDVAAEPSSLPPAVRVVATYPASDGSAPESIEVVWETSHPSEDGLARVIAALAAVTRRRHDLGPDG